MDRTIEARSFGKDNVVVGCSVLVLCTCSICSIVYMMLFACYIYGVVCISHIKC